MTYMSDDDEFDDLGDIHCMSQSSQQSLNPSDMPLDI